MKPVEPKSLGRGKGFSHGMVAEGRVLFLAGQCAYDDKGDVTSDDFVKQFDRVLERLVEVVKAAGGKTVDIGSLTAFVTRMDEYRASRKALGTVWRARMGKHFPAMALIGVKELVHPKAKVEIQGWAVLKSRSSTK